MKKNYKSNTKNIKKIKMKKIYIDGEHGTTGLELKKHLMPLHQKKIEILFSDEDKKKDIVYKKEMYQKSDLVVLCLPDQAAIDSVAMIHAINENSADKKIKCLDTSSAHRVSQDWTYGFAEITGEENIKTSNLISNPGCYATGFIGAVRPLIEKKIISDQFCFCCKGISGYSGGGKPLINYYQNVSEQPIFAPYSLELNHKHVKEMKAHSLLKNSPLFLPSVVPTYRGMLVMIYLPFVNINEINQNNGIAKITSEKILTTLKNYYNGNDFVKISSWQDEQLLEEKFLNFFDSKDEKLNEKLNQKENQKEYNHSLEIILAGNEDNAVLISRLDNLGRGSATAAVENIFLMLEDN